MREKASTDTSLDEGLFPVLKGTFQIAGVWKYIHLSFYLSNFLDYICPLTFGKLRTEHKVSSLYSMCHEKKKTTQRAIYFLESFKIKVTDL